LFFVHALKSGSGGVLNLWVRIVVRHMGERGGDAWVLRGILFQAGNSLKPHRHTAIVKNGLQ
jgi:hypothetical protein